MEDLNLRALIWLSTWIVGFIACIWSTWQAYLDWRAAEPGIDMIAFWRARQKLMSSLLGLLMIIGGITSLIKLSEIAIISLLAAGGIYAITEVLDVIDRRRIVQQWGIK